MTASVYRTSNGDLVQAVVVLNANSDGTTSAGGTGGTAQQVQIATGSAIIGGTTQAASSQAANGTSASTPLISLATTNAAVVKASGGLVFGYCFNNTHATNWAYVKLFNKATAPVPGTDSPIMVIAIPPAGKAERSLPISGVAFATGIGIAVTGAPALLDTTAVLAAQVNGQIEFK